ncbi:MAG: hypothetical protein HY205_04675 [Nitrospirae bacterium]|nr:hypothetical protein [Nitrospirota bacterium]
MKRVLLVSAVLLLFHAPAWAQSVSGVRGMNGGVAPLFNLTGPGNLYTDTQGTQGYIYAPSSNFQTYNFRVPYGQAWSGAMMTLGPQMSVGLISGANQGGFSTATGTVVLSSSATVFPPPPRVTSPLPRIQSSILEFDPEDIP